jgi:Putative DNA-binding domain
LFIRWYSFPLTAMPKIIPLSEMFAILQSGDFDKLIGGLEDEHLECKAAPYQLGQEAERMELAKDVTALANADGGVLLIGVTTETEPTFRGDKIRGCGCVADGVVDFDRYQKVLSDWVVPSIPSLRFEWHPNAANKGEGIVSITVPQAASAGRPYLVAKAVSESGRVIGSLVGYFERVRDTVAPMKAAEIRDKLKDGLRFAELSPRLGNIEAMVGNLIAPPSQPQPAFSFESEIFQRVKAARHALGYEGKPTFTQAAWPLQPVEFPGLFQSRNDDIVKLLENPPQLRSAGFNLTSGTASAIAEGKLRRCVAPQFRLLEIWRDGLLVSVVQGDDGHLCWGTIRTNLPDMQINNIVLTETVFLFCHWAFTVYQYAVPKPERIAIRIMFADMSQDGHSFALNNVPLTRFTFGSRGRPAPNSAGQHFGTEADLNSGAGVVAYQLLKEVYVWFGFDEDDIPYVNRNISPPEIDPAQIVST